MGSSVKTNLKSYLKGGWKVRKEDILVKKDLKALDPNKVRLLDPEGSGKKSHDYENAVMLFEYWKDMNVTQATDVRLWTYLCHVPFMDFLRKRRPIEEIPEAGREAHIIKHWFVMSPGTAAFKYNDLYLFWWGPYLTYDENRKDPYELTKELFSMLDYTRHILTSVQGKNRPLAHAVLEYVIENPDLFEQFKSEKVRLIARRLNFIAGYRTLIALNKQEIKNIIASFRNDIEKEKAKGGSENNSRS